MGLLQDMAPWYTDEQRADFIKGALTYLPALVDPTKHELVQVGDRFGNHLTLIYNRRFIAEPPKTTDELIALAAANTIDEDGDGRKERYGLVWSFVEPYFAIPFLTGHGAWVFAESPPAACRRSARARPRYARVDRRLSIHPVAARQVSRRARQLRLRAGRLALQDRPRGDDHQRRLELDRLPRRTPSIDAAVAVLPIVSSTGMPMKPMIMPKGYSLNANASPEAAAAAMAFVRYMTSPAVQQRIVEKLRMIPARQSRLRRVAVVDRPDVPRLAGPSRAHAADSRRDGAPRRVGRDAAPISGRVERRDDTRSRRRRHAARRRGKDRPDAPASAPDALRHRAAIARPAAARRLGHLAA